MTGLWEPGRCANVWMVMKTTALVSTVTFEAGMLPRRSVADGQRLSPSDPAVLAITDFTREQPATVDPDRQIDDALNDMVRLGVLCMAPPVVGGRRWIAD